MNTLESKLRIAHQIQVAAMNKGMTCSISTMESGNFTIAVHHKETLVEFTVSWDATEQELLDWWEAIAK
jgi:hypothetical protein